MTFRIVKFNHKIFLEEDTMKKFAKIAAVALVVVLSLAALVACGPNSDPEKAIAALKKNGYKAAKDDTVIPAALRLLGVKVDSVVTGTKTSGEGDNAKIDHVTIIYFASADQAKENMSKIEEYAKKNDSDSNGSDWEIKQSGAMIYYGTKAGISAAR